MADNKAFEKIHEDIREKEDLGGILEQFNLPPSVIEFVRKKQKMIFGIIAVVVVLLIAWAVLNSHANHKAASSTSALSQALKSKDEQYVAELNKVASQFSGTDAAKWAKIETAQYYMSKGKFQEAFAEYKALDKNVSKKSPLYPLYAYGIAQAQESMDKKEEALKDYQILQNIKGFERIGYFGTSRIFEEEKKYDEAAKELEKYMGIIVGDTGSSQEKSYIQARISQLEGMQ